MATAPHPDDPPPPGRPGVRRRRGIQTRVVTASVVLVASALTVAVLVTWQVLLARVDERIETAMVQEVEELRLLADGTDPETGRPFGDDAAAIFEVFLGRNVPEPGEAFYTFVDGAPFLRSFTAPRELLELPALADRWAATTEPTRSNDDTPLGPIRWLAVPLLSPTDERVVGTFVVVFFPEAEQAEVLAAVRVVAVTGIVTLVLAGLVAWSIAGRVVRPIRGLTATARTLNERDLSGRFETEGDDEVAELGATFNEMVERLEQGFDQQRRFLDDVAHELRTPITIAQGHLDLLEAMTDDTETAEAAEAAEAVGIVRDELDRMGRYVSDLLLLAKAERPDFLHIEPVDLGELAAVVLERVGSLGRRGWTDDGSPRPGRVAVLADPVRLEQALLNLAGNAVEHTAEGDEIGIGITVVPGGEHTAPVVELRVRDTGPGVAPEVAETLFHRHTRGASARTQRREGMGIGLSIVDAIARAHGGHAAVRPTPGGGATFVVTIPLDTGLTGQVPAVEPVPDPSEVP